MNWNDSTGPPSHLFVNGVLMSKAKDMAHENNVFFKEKVADIQATSIMTNKNCSLISKHFSKAKDG